jgi:hypothetical protein
MLPTEVPGLSPNDLRRLVRAVENLESGRAQQFGLVRAAVARLRAALDEGDGEQVRELAYEVCELVEDVPPAAA